MSLARVKKTGENSKGVKKHRLRLEKGGKDSNKMLSYDTETALQGAL